MQIMLGWKVVKWETEKSLNKLISLRHILREPQKQSFFIHWDFGFIIDTFVLNCWKREKIEGKDESFKNFSKKILYN